MGTPQHGQDEPYGQQPQYPPSGYLPPGYPPPGYPRPGYPPQGPPGPPPRKRWGRRVLLIVAGMFGLLVVLGVIGALAGGSPSGHPAAVTTGRTPATSAPPTPATTSAAPAASPNGTYSGSCDYTLGGDPNSQNYLVGEVDVTNTGNIGTIVRVRITWPQEGYAPITARQRVRVAAGATDPVRFHVPAGSIASGSNVIDLLQSWQNSHSGNGCTYNATITGTYGQPH